MSLDVYLDGNTCAHCGRSDETFWQNYTHNAGKMATEAGIYDCLWEPDLHSMWFAEDLIQPLRAGIAAMKDDPMRFMRLQPGTDWGSYDTFLPWCEKYLAACIANPTAKVRVSR